MSKDESKERDDADDAKAAADSSSKKKRRKKKGSKKKPASESASEAKAAKTVAEADEDGAAAISERPGKLAKADSDDHAAAAHAAHADGHHKPDRRQYVMIWVFLLVVTLLEVGAAELYDPDPTKAILSKTSVVVLMVGMALAKAATVAMYYMHLKHETKVMRWTVLIPMIFPALYAFILIAEGVYRSVWGA